MIRVMKITCASALLAWGSFAAMLPAHAAEDGGGLADDWDWGAIEAMDDTPVNTGNVKTAEPAAKPSQRLTVKEVTSPDPDAEPREAYALFPDMPSFRVVASRKDKEMHPCSNCHEWVPPIKEARELPSPHDNFELKHGLHGKGQFWCFTCHDDKGQRKLRTFEGETIEFEDAYILCSQCHVDQARDWAFGAHGKRLDNWQGERVVYNCTACHYQHSPAWSTRTAKAGPSVRIGLERPAHWVPAAQRETHWEGYQEIWQNSMDPQKGDGS